MIKSLKKIGEDEKVRLLDRIPINDMLSFFDDPAKNDGNNVVFISHNINVPSNYAYFDILYTGFPFIHNSPTLKEENIGFFYSGIFEGAKYISKAIESYEVNENILKNHEYLKKMDSYDIEVVNKFTRLVEDCTKKNDDPPTLKIEEL